MRPLVVMMSRVLSFEIFIVFLSIFSVLGIGPNPVYSVDCDWVDSTGEAVVENITPDDARQAAINRARISAIESKIGVKVYASTMIKDLDLMADIVRTLSQGYIVDEKIIKWEQGVYQDSPDKAPLTTYKVKLNACVTGVGEKDPFFKIEAKLNKSVFMAGEEAILTLKASRDSYLNIFNLTADDRIRLIAPSAILPVISVKANEEYSFPPEGFGFVMSVMKDKKRSFEYFIIVATKESFDFIGLDKRAEGLAVPEFYRAILKIPSDAKAEEILVYEVVSK